MDANVLIYLLQNQGFNFQSPRGGFKRTERTCRLTHWSNLQTTTRPFSSSNAFRVKQKTLEHETIRFKLIFYCIEKRSITSKQPFTLSQTSLFSAMPMLCLLETQSVASTCRKTKERHIKHCRHDNRFRTHFGHSPCEHVNNKRKGMQNNAWTVWSPK